MADGLQRCALLTQGAHLCRLIRPDRIRLRVYPRQLVARRVTFDSAAAPWGLEPLYNTSAEHPTRGFGRLRITIIICRATCGALIARSYASTTPRRPQPRRQRRPPHPIAGGCRASGRQGSRRARHSPPPSRDHPILLAAGEQCAASKLPQASVGSWEDLLQSVLNYGVA